jgi:CheY-like chemotaxis protein
MPPLRKPKRRRHRILVVEDNQDTREAMVEVLQMTGHDVIAASNGREALDLLEHAPAPDLIILDLWMPVMDGRQFRAEQLKHPKLKNIPVVVVTAMSDQPTSTQTQ